ncbi:hypothetical protein RB195_025043 [Necator americanus]|uniref:Uncharacterized protein n=1 Tax=Necator americanus TaxID=51031 RepID=A0ABR1EQM5_NECAM
MITNALETQNDAAATYQRISEYARCHREEGSSIANKRSYRLNVASTHPFNCVSLNNLMWFANDAHGSQHTTIPQKSPLLWRNQWRIQRLIEREHFHYPVVELGPIIVSLISMETKEDTRCNLRVESNGTTW